MAVEPCGCRNASRIVKAACDMSAAALDAGADSEEQPYIKHCERHSESHITELERRLWLAQTTDRLALELATKVRAYLLTYQNHELAELAAKVQTALAGKQGREAVDSKEVEDLRSKVERLEAAGDELAAAVAWFDPKGADGLAEKALQSWREAKDPK